jgi:hypothetical protein
VNRLSLPINSSATLNAGQFIYILSDLELLVSVTPDPVSSETPVSGTTTLYGNYFVFTGSYLITGITITNPSTASGIATIQVALIT